MTDCTGCARLMDPSLGGTGEVHLWVVRVAELVSDWIARLIRKQTILDRVAAMMTWSCGRDGRDTGDEKCDLGETENCHCGLI